MIPRVTENNRNGSKYIIPIVVGVLILVFIGIGTSFLERGKSITRMEGRVNSLEKAVDRTQLTLKEIDREHDVIQINQLRIANLEESHR